MTATPYNIEIEDADSALIEGNSELVASLDAKNCFVNIIGATRTYISKNAIYQRNAYCFNGVRELPRRAMARSSSAKLGSFSGSDLRRGVFQASQQRTIFADTRPRVAFRESTTSCASYDAGIVVGGMVGDDQHAIIFAKVLERPRTMFRLYFRPRPTVGKNGSL